MLFKLYSRAYQWIMKSTAHLLDWQPPAVINCVGCIEKLAPKLTEQNIKKVLIVTDEGIVQAGLLDKMLNTLSEEDIIYFIYKGTTANPTTKNIAEAVKVYNDQDCEGIIGFGGGSAIDCAKGTGIAAARNTTDFSRFKGVLKVRKTLPYFIAVPTTAGTGSEATIAAVITDSETKEKYAIIDTKLMPDAAVLDPELLLGLPKDMTAFSGMDALTHAVESYINQSNTKQTKMLSEEAIELIYDNLYKSYEDGQDIQARTNMQRASYFAGKAFTRAYVGNVHAMAHALGAKYNVQHGQAVSIILPHILEEYGEVIHEKLAHLGDIAKVTEEGDSNEVKAEKFIASIKDLNEKMNVGTVFQELKDEDLKMLADAAYKEANPLYPVPVMFSKADFIRMYKKVMVS
ncbi:alcohol dehydrogenase [Jeotgalicoccus coquinae]|uniref:1,3-propanediol dehydrogenase n=1 Tax=Jeotgalicoccus coquinae TaxID=709509 RepID=A0A6V7RR47_9STAP|nr:iron-containing alcohol dehydrogenase [Jeotgalicoccus coquinae]MBB6424122.1 alcohol dehydrogenase class IV [Jeotgalicoccus coquinae]GGE26344.1 alcohol dehydrogenase [Jeotgalicoccus coquinae]CAD2081330.1 1,3-propanediol dehydrogenase [Jeotgalicoccus coquinae]